MSELKPCPFCGNELPVHYIAMQNRYVQLISCPSCYATISCNKFLSDRDALATWNSRPIEDALNARIAELEAENAELKERVAMLDVTAVYKSLGEMGYIDQVDKLNARIAELKEVIEMLIDQQREVKNHLIDKNLHIDSLYEEGYKLQQRIAELEAAQRWIPVSERLPEFNKVVAVIDMSDKDSHLCNVYETAMLVEVRGDTRFGFIGHSGWDSSDVTHWMPLPELPEVQE
jgi:hypothetical protein